MWKLGFSFVVACTFLSAYSALATDTLGSGPEAAAAVSVQNISVRGGVVSGVLVNNSSTRLLRDVRLLIRYAWLWRNEHAPKRDNPGRAARYAVPGEIPPGESLAFTYRPSPPLPSRSDGHFETSVEVVGFTEVGE